MPFEIKVWGFRNPISLQPLTGFVAKVMDGTGLIEVSKDLSLSVTQPSVIKVATASLESGSTQVLGVSTIRIDFSSPVPLDLGCNLQVTIPNDFADLRLSLTAVKVYGIFGFIQSLPFSVVDQYVIINGACQTFLDASSPGSIRLEGLKNPSLVKDTATFKLVITDSSGGMLATTKDPFIIPAASFTPGTFTSVKLELSNPTIQEASGIFFNVQPTNKLTQHARLIVSMPPEFTLNSSSPLSVTSLKSLDPTAMESVADLTTNRFLVRNLFYSFGYNPKIDGPMTFNLTSIVAQNPSMTLPRGEIKVQTYDLIEVGTSTTKASYGLVDEFLFSTSGLLTPGSFKNANITTDSIVANTFPTNATIRLTLNHAVAAGSQLIAQLPADFGVAKLQTTCVSAVGFNLVTPSCTVTNQPDGSTLVVVNDTKALLPGSSLQIKLTSIRLPRYQGKVEYPISVSVGKGDALINRSSVDFYNQRAQSFTSFSLQLGSYMCSALTELTMTFSKPAQFALNSGDKFVLTLQTDDFQIEPQSLNCSLNQVSTPCTYDSSKRALTIGSLIDYPTFQLKVKGFRNSQSIKPPVPFSFALIDTKNRLLVDLPEPQFLQAKEPAAIDLLRVIQSTTDPEVASDYSFEFALQTAMTKLFISIELQPCMAFQSTTVSHLSQSFNQFNSDLITPQKLMVELPLVKTGYQGFTIKGLVNPSESCLASGGVKISLFEDSQLAYLMAQSTVQPSLSCQGLCSACSVMQKDFCTACKAGFALTVESGTCSEVCPVGSIFDLTSKQCAKCDESCSACEGATGFCTACSDPQALKTQEGLCISQPECKSLSSHFIDRETKSCQKCKEPCMECTADQCLNCASDFFLYRGDCVETCPVGTITDVEKYGNQCLGEPDSLIFLKLFSDAPLVYLMIVLFFGAGIAKVTCMKQMSLLVTLLIICNLMETLSLIILSTRSIKPAADTSLLTQFEKSSLQFTPLAAILAVLVLNMYVVTLHCSSLKPCAKSEIAAIDEYARWTHQQSFKRTLIYSVACLCSFHNLNWFNYLGLFPDSFKVRLVKGKFISLYSFVSRISMVFPRIVICSYCVYFGVMNANGKIKVESEGATDLVAATVEHLLVCLLSVFLLFLALNFSWYDDPAEIITQHELSKQTQLNESEQQDKSEPELYIPKSSIEMHMLRSSRVINQPRRGNVSRRENFKPSIDSMQYGFNETRLHDTNNSKQDLLTVPDTVAQPPVPKSKSALPKMSEETDLNFDFLEQMKQTIIASKKPNKNANASEGKQLQRKSYNDSERTIKTQRFQAKHITIAPPNLGHLRNLKGSLGTVDEVSNSTNVVGSRGYRSSGIIMEPVQEKEKASSAGRVSEQSARTKPESLIKDFDSDQFKGSPLSKRLSVELSPPVRQSPKKKMSKFAKNYK